MRSLGEFEDWTIKIYSRWPTRRPLFLGGGAMSLESLTSRTRGRPSCGLLQSRSGIAMSIRCKSCLCAPPLLMCRMPRGSARLPGSWLGWVACTGLQLRSCFIAASTGTGRFWLLPPPSLSLAAAMRNNAIERNLLNIDHDVMWLCDEDKCTWCSSHWTTKTKYNSSPSLLSHDKLWKLYFGGRILSIFQKLYLNSSRK